MNKCLFKVAKTTNVYQMGTSSWTNPENSKCKIGDQLGPKGRNFDKMCLKTCDTNSVG